MWGLILGAGFGKRMLPITEKRAKPSLPFQGVPIVRQIAERLSSVTKKIGVNLFYRPQDVVEALSGLEVVFSMEATILGTSGGIIKMVEAFSIKEDIIVHNGDSLLSIDYGNLIEFHRRSGAPITIVVSSGREGYTRFLIRDNQIEFSRDGNYVYCGAMVISSKILGEIPEGENIIKDFAIKHKVNPYPIEEFLEFTDPHSYLEKHYGRTVVEEGAYVAPGAIIEKSIVLKGSIIETGAVIINSIVVSGRVLQGDIIKDKIFIDGRTYEIS